MTLSLAAYWSESPTLALVGRDRELAAVDEFLGGVASGPAALIFAGDAGIGKTTVWSSAVERAEARGYVVLACRPAQAEARLSYAALGDLLGPLTETEFEGLPDPQRRAIDAALLRADAGDGRVDQRAVSAAVASLLRSIGERHPVVLAIDDVQWLDASSARVLAYAIRRLDRTTPVGVVVSVRVDSDDGDPLALGRALPRDRSLVVQLAPLSLGALRQLLTARLGVSVSRPVLLRIAHASGGNPLFALELADVMSEAGPWSGDEVVPEHLRHALASRIKRLPATTRAALLAASALTRPTVGAIELAEIPSAALDTAEAAGIVQVRDGRIRFVHPLLASAAYGLATPAERRKLHRRLAVAVVEPEERAHHVALAATGPDADAAAVVERAASRARARGAPDAAAELLEWALRLTPPTHSRARQRRILLAAEEYFYAGDRGRARALLEHALVELPISPLRADALRLLAELRFYDDSWPAAVPLLEEALRVAGIDAEQRARIGLDLSYAAFNIGDIATADAIVPAIFDDAERAGRHGLVAQALATRVTLDMLLGRGVDEAALERALELEDWGERTVLPLRPSWVAGQAFLLTGQLDRAHVALAQLRDRLVERGLESDLPASAWLTVTTECLRGKFAEAALLAAEAVRGSLELESRTTRALALTANTIVAAYAGAVEDARRDGHEALAIISEIGWGFGFTAVLWPLGFLALSTGEPAETHRLLGPLADRIEARELGGPMITLFLADEIEALVALGDLDRAERLLVPLEQQSSALERPWGRATAAGRCRALLVAAKGESGVAASGLHELLAQHRRMEIPFELGRTLLVLGELRRRNRQKRAASEALEEARGIFEDLGTPLWSARARSGLRRLGLRGPAANTGGLTATEERVAKLAASGMTNREIAAQLFVSPKTVEANLRKVYEKLGVRSRAQLGARAADLDLMDR